MQEHRLAAGARDDDRPAGLDHAAGDAFADPVLDRRPGLLEAVRRFDPQLAALVQQRDDAAHRAVMAREDLEHVVHRRLQVQRPGQRLADFEQRRQAADFRRLALAGRGLARFLQSAHRIQPTTVFITLILSTLLS